MNSFHITNAIVEQHRAQLEGQARLHRQARAAMTETRRTRQRPDLMGALRRLGRALRPSRVSREPGRPVTLVVVGEAPSRERKLADQPPVRQGELVGAATTDAPCPI